MEAVATVEEAYRRWAPELVAYASSLVGPTDAPDVVADVFVTMLRRGRDAWDRLGEPRPYLFRAVTNEARMRHRATGRRERREQRWQMVAEDSAMPDPRFVEVLQQLSVRQRAVAYLAYWDDLSVAQIAALLGISEGSVKRHLERARTALRPALEAEVAR